MLCDDCGKNVAKIKWTIYVNGKQNDVYLCEDCAKKRGNAASFNAVQLGSLLAEILNHKKQQSVGDEAAELQKTCPTCGITLKKVKKLGRFGCAECYNTFREFAGGFIQQVQSGSTHHTGKAPDSLTEDDQRQRRIDQLKAELGQAVEIEAFERAAQLRDEIRALEVQKEGV